MAMTKRTSIGIIGAGFVGGTCARAFRQADFLYDVLVYDKNPSMSENTLEQVAECDFVFVAVPTPSSKETGQCYTNIVESCVASVRNINKNNIIVIKSTVPPGTTKALDEKYGRVMFQPEFLTEANAFEDFIRLPYQIFGLTKTAHKDDDDVKKLAGIFLVLNAEKKMDCSTIYFMSSEQAEMVKYTRNNYLATRLSFFNEIKQIATKLGISYEDLKFFAGMDGRIGNHYNSVDPKNPGWGGKCLFKDNNALIYAAKQLGVEPTVLQAVKDKNLEVRAIHDWLNIDGTTI